MGGLCTPMPALPLACRKVPLPVACATAVAGEEDPMRRQHGKRPPRWFALALWSGIAGVAALLAAAIGVVQP